MKKEDIILTLDALAQHDHDVARGLALVGYPEPRTSPSGFATLLQIIVSQQISRDAAGAIRGRLEALYPSGSAAEFSKLTDAELRGAGLSRPKIVYARGLVEAVLNGALDPHGMNHLSDAEAVAVITALKGFGRWSAEIYCMFALDRRDLFPGEDIALQEAMRRLLGLEERPKPAQARKLAERWRPYRSTMATFLWHYYRGAPQN